MEWSKQASLGSGWIKSPPSSLSPSAKHNLGCQEAHHATAQVWLQTGHFSENDSSLCAQVLQTGFWAEVAPMLMLRCVPGTCCLLALHRHGGGSSLGGGRSCLVLSVSQAECFSCHLMRHSWSMSASPPAAARRLHTAGEMAAAISAG